MSEPEYQLPLFDYLPEQVVSEIEFKELRSPIWTENKAKLVAEYLRLFVFITKHGCYIDGFAGPKQPDIPGTWAAQLMLDIRPALLRYFFLCDQDPVKVIKLRELVNAQPNVRGRKIDILEGDFNKRCADVLASGVITPRMATFCLLDQFSTECHWSTVQALASHKTTGPKIELFYFLASGWLDRALTGFKRNVYIPEQWWGRTDWRGLRGIKSQERALRVCGRFRDELSYKFAYAWPIYDRSGGRRVMFHMIHATDHAEAPKLMYRAYKHATEPTVVPKQLELELETTEPLAKRLTNSV